MSLPKVTAARFFGLDVVDWSIVLLCWLLLGGVLLVLA
jgi:hypothetical protein